MSACRSCGAEIIWCLTEKGKRMPVDAGRYDDGNLVIDLYGVAHVDPVNGNRKSHFVTCPNADSHRRRR